MKTRAMFPTFSLDILDIYMDDYLHTSDGTDILEP